MQIRFAEKHDLPQLVHIYNQSIDARSTAVLEKVTPEEKTPWFEAHFRDQYPIWLAESQGSILGYLYLTAYRSGRSALKHTVEVSYFVDFSYHKRGVASKLLETCMQACQERGIKNLFAILLETNTASIALLKKFNFEQWAHLPEVAEIDGKCVGQVYYGRKV